MHPSRRRKKRPNYGIRTVEVIRGPNGFGFTISGQQPCILSCIVSNSPADQAGLRAGDFLISVNGVSVSKITHDAVVNLIGNCVGPIKMTIAENYYSDSSDEELDCGRLANSRKPKYLHKSRPNRLCKSDLRRAVVENSNDKNVMKMKECILKNLPNARFNANVFNGEPESNALNVSNPLPMEDEAGPIEYKALVGYLGTIEMPKQLLPNSRLQTVCSCIRKLRQEKRTPTAVLMTVLPTCLTLKNASNHILAIYPTNRVVYVGSTADKESRYFGLVTSAVCDTRSNESLVKRYGEPNIWQEEEKKSNNADAGLEISNSCHVFVTDPKIVDHNVHVKKAESFKFSCTTDLVTGNCLEFPRNALYIVSLVQNMYKLQNSDMQRPDEANLGPLVANSPQPSASSNSDSGIGFRDDCGNISDRILVVEFPAHRSVPFLNNNCGEANVQAEPSEERLNNHHHSFELNNSRNQGSFLYERPNNLSKSDIYDNKNLDMKQLNNLNNIRACDGVSIKNFLERPDNFTKHDYLVKQNNDTESQFNNYVEYNRLTCRAMPDPSIKKSPSSVSSDDNTRMADVDTGQIYIEKPVDVPEEALMKKSYETMSIQSVTDELDFKSSVDNISVHSSKSNESTGLRSIFKVPSTKFFEVKKSKSQLKTGSSCDNIDKYCENIINYKLSPKVYGISKPNYSCEELNNLDSVEKYGYGSLQDLYSWEDQKNSRRHIAQSAPDVRMSRNTRELLKESLCDQNGNARCDGNSEGPAAWATSLEKLLDDPFGLHTFAEFLKKEFSVENIYFWTACERYRRLPPNNERTLEAQRIYQQHLCAGAPEPVNVDAQGRQCAEQGLQEASCTLFDQAQKQIFNLMKFDSYPRFLKSDLYKQCLAGDCDKPQADSRLMLQSVQSTPAKLKKSLSNAEDRRRKSLLPWHRKNRSKSKDRGESEYIQRKQIDIVVSNEAMNGHIGKTCNSDIHSSKSSLTSLDLAITNSQESPKSPQEDLGRTALCRVNLSNGSTTVIQIKPSETIQQLVGRVLDKRGIAYSSFEVFTNKHSKAVDVSQTSAILAGCEVNVEQRVVFKLDLPNRKVISVKSKYTKIIVDVLRPILHKYNFNLDQVRVTYTNKLVDIHQPVTTIDGKRLNIQLCEEIKNGLPENPTISVQHIKTSKMEDITNKLFEGILQEKSQTAIKLQKSDKGSVKSEDWGSEHSSGIFGKFLRRDSTMHDRKKKSLVQKNKTGSSNSSTEDMSHDPNQVRKPLIAKLKAGANKLQVTCSESDELVEGLTRAQRSRLEDQRGTEINFELPDFLKDKENGRNFPKPHRRSGEMQNSRFYLGENLIHPKLDRLTAIASAKSLKLDSQSNYENRHVLLLNETSKICQNQQSNLNNVRIYSPSTYSSEESSRSTNSSPSKSANLENTVIEVKMESPKSVDPPPLPPKPKIVPIKPPNWGQNGFYKTKDLTPSDRSNQTLYLEQPSSSFV